MGAKLCYQSVQDFIAERDPVGDAGTRPGLIRSLIKLSKNAGQYKAFVNGANGATCSSKRVLRSKTPSPILGDERVQCDVSHPRICKLICADGSDRSETGSRPMGGAIGDTLQTFCACPEDE